MDKYEWRMKIRNALIDADPGVKTPQNLAWEAMKAAYAVMDEASAEMDRLRAEVERQKSDWNQQAKFWNANTRKDTEEIRSLRAQFAIAREALSLIATPKRPDGTYNRSREACERLAHEALAAMYKERG